MKEWLKDIFLTKPQHPLDVTTTRTGEEQLGKQRGRKLRVKTSPPYDGNRSEEYTIKVLNAARNSDKPHIRRLWLNKGQKEIDRAKETEKKFFD